MNPATSSRPRWLQHPVNSLHVHVQVSRLGVAASTDLALVRPVLAVAAHVPLQQAGLAELARAGRALKGGREGGRGRHPLLQLLPAARQPAAVVRRRQVGQAGQRYPCRQGQACTKGLQGQKRSSRSWVIRGAAVNSLAHQIYLSTRDILTCSLLYCGGPK